MSTPPARETPSATANSSFTWPDAASVEVNKLIKSLLGTIDWIKDILTIAEGPDPSREDLVDFFNVARKALAGHIDHLDFTLEHLSLPTEKPCPKTCPGNAPPSALLAPAAPAPVPPASTATYATVAARPLPAQAPRPQRKPSARKGPVAVLNPVRLIVRSADASRRTKPFAFILCHGPSEPFRRLSHAMSLSPSTKDVTLLGVHRNRSENLIVSLPHGTSDSAVAAVSTVIHSTFSDPSSARPLPLQITRDVPWVKLMVSSVPARSTPGAPTYSEEEVKTSFMLNPAIKTLSITRAPRWVRNPASITGIHSSFTFSFEDPDGSLARSLAKSRLFMFGEPVHLKRWIDKPLAKRDRPLPTTADRMEE
ncbi:hypothetical protein FRC09_010347 [Ceratobasidium sp. 395]|nr:hypothetical protein FRC09_010347 [Ceratobasidium sp. 395]